MTPNDRGVELETSGEVILGVEPIPLALGLELPLLATLIGSRLEVRMGRLLSATEPDRIVTSVFEPPWTERLKSIVGRS